MPPIKIRFFSQEPTLFVQYKSVKARTAGLEKISGTGCPAVDRTTLIAHISLMPGPIIKPFDSMKVKTGRIFLVHDKSS